MNGNYNYNNPNIPAPSTSVWVGNNATNIAMEPLVDKFGNLRFGNQVIPLTTPVTPYINQAPSLPNLTTPPPVPLSSPVLSSPPEGPFYVVSVQESPPANIVSDPIGNLKAQAQVKRESPYNTVGIQQTQLQTESPYNTVGIQQTQIQTESPYNTVGIQQTQLQTESPYNAVGIQQTQLQTESPYSTVGIQPTQVQRQSPYSTVGIQPTQIQSPYNAVGIQQTQNDGSYGNLQTNYSGANGNVVNFGLRPNQMINGAYTRQRIVSNPEIQPMVLQRQRRVSAPEPNPSPFRGQPYMKQLAIDHSNGEVIRFPEQELPPVTSGKYTTQVSIGENGGIDRQMGGKQVYTSTGSVNDGTDTSSMSSTSMSPYSSMPSSPRPDPQGSSGAPLVMEEKQVYEPVPPRYVKPSDKSRCLMCEKTVYHMEKRGPIKDVLFHKGCFKCAVCNMTLDLKNFCQNDNDLADLNVYCKSHKPSEKHGKLDAGALSINRALQAPRLSQVNEQIRGGIEAMKGGKMDASALNIKSAMNAPKPDFSSGENVRRTSHSYSIDNEAVSMVHARNVPATELQVANKRRDQVWSRDDRKAEGVPPPDVIRHDSEIRGYGGEPYRHDPPEESTYRYT